MTSYQPILGGVAKSDLSRLASFPVVSSHDPSRRAKRPRRFHQSQKMEMKRVSRRTDMYGMDIHLDFVGARDREKPGWFGISAERDGDLVVHRHESVHR